MVRPRVSEENRQRVANACDDCKRRKSKCNGRNPCEKCLKREKPCVYSLPGSVKERRLDSVQEPALKRRHVKEERDSPADEADSPSMSQATPSDKVALNESEGPPSLHQASLARTNSPTSGSRPSESMPVSSTSTASGSKEEDAAKPQNGSRMLCHPTGHLLFLGDSASLSFLQLVRMVCSNWMNDQFTPFTHDEKRHSMLENMESKAPADLHPPHVLALPGRHAANVLIDSYFTNTSGLVALLDRHEFAISVDTCYLDPLTAKSSSLCLLYLVLAIGLVLAAPLPGSQEEAVIQNLRHHDFDRAEAFFQSARRIGDPLTDIGNSEFESLQALTLMSLYMLTVSRRNAAYTLLGPAVRLAFSLGLHRGWETKGNFYDSQWRYLILRKNLFRSIYILDRFLSALLGRPTGISDDDLSPDALNNPRDIRPSWFGKATGVSANDVLAGCGSTAPEPPFLQTTTPAANPESGAESNTTACVSRRGSAGIFGNLECGGSGLDAAVSSARAIGDILKRIYSQREVSTRLARDVAKAYHTSEEGLNKTLPMSVIQDSSISATPEKVMETMHVWLLHYHTVILLSRPFFLHLFITMFNSTRPPSMAAASNGKIIYAGGNPTGTFPPSSAGPRSQTTGRVGRKMEGFSEACLRASICSIDLIDTVFRSGRLARRNPFVIYFLFVAALVLLANEFASLYDYPSYSTTIEKVQNIIGDFARTDPQAMRLRFIITEFSSVIGKRQEYPGYPVTLPSPNPLSDRGLCALILTPESKTQQNSGVDVAGAKVGIRFVDRLGPSPEMLSASLMPKTAPGRPLDQTGAGELVSGPYSLGLLPEDLTPDEPTFRFNMAWAPPGSHYQQVLRPGSSENPALPDTVQSSRSESTEGPDSGNRETVGPASRTGGNARRIELFQQRGF